MPTRQYVGARYVPKIYTDENGTAEWSNAVPYESLTIVTHNGNSYTSKQTVPAGVDILNSDYWVLTGNFNAQVALLSDNVPLLSNNLNELKGKSILIAGTSNEYLQENSWTYILKDMLSDICNVSVITMSNFQTNVQACIDNVNNYDIFMCVQARNEIRAGMAMGNTTTSGTYLYGYGLLKSLVDLCAEQNKRVYCLSPSKPTTEDFANYKFGDALYRYVTQTYAVNCGATYVDCYLGFGNYNTGVTSDGVHFKYPYTKNMAEYIYNVLMFGAFKNSCSIAQTIDVTNYATFVNGVTNGKVLLTFNDYTVSIYAVYTVSDTINASEPICTISDELVSAIPIYQCAMFTSSTSGSFYHAPDKSIRVINARGSGVWYSRVICDLCTIFY